jgi:hypothetical protein
MGTEGAERPKNTTGPPKAKLSLTGAEKTVIPMVFFRSMDAQRPDPILGDTYSQGIMDRIEMDLNEDQFITDDRFIEYVMNRAKHLDNWCQVWLEFILGNNKVIRPKHMLNKAYRKKADSASCSRSS